MRCRKLKLAGALAAVALTAGCAGAEAPVADSPSAASSSPESSAPASASPQSSEEVLRQTSDAALAALAAADYEALAELVHPVEGVRFAPYGYVDVEQGVALMPEHVADLGEDDKLYIWGADAGTGEPLKMTFAQYNEKYLYDQQFLHADEIAVNESRSGGSSTDNTAEVFGDAQFVDYHFRGFDEQYDGLDWETLRVVLREREGRWYVVGLIHDSWTP